MRAMFRVLLLIVTGAVPSAAQITVSPQRIAGLSPANWSIGDGGPAVDALLGPSALAWDRAGNLLIADTRNQRIRLMTPGGVISTHLRVLTCRLLTCRQQGGDPESRIVGHRSRNRD